MALTQYGGAHSYEESYEEVDEEVVRGGYNLGGGGLGYGYEEVEMVMVVEETLILSGPIQRYNPPPPPLQQYYGPMQSYNPLPPPPQQYFGGSGYGYNNSSGYYGNDNGYAPRSNPGPNQTQQYQGGYPSSGSSPYSPQGGSYSSQDSYRSNRDNRYENSDISNSNNHRGGPVNLSISKI